MASIDPTWPRNGHGWKTVGCAEVAGMRDFQCEAAGGVTLPVVRLE